MLPLSPGLYRAVKVANGVRFARPAFVTSSWSLVTANRGLVPFALPGLAFDREHAEQNGHSMLALLGLLLATAAVAPASSSAAGDVRIARPSVHVTVRVEGGVALDPRIVAAVTASIREVWRPYADVTFAAGGLRIVPRSETITLVFTDRIAVAPASDGDALGAIEFVNGRPSSTVSVSVTAVSAMLERTVWMDAPWRKMPAFVRSRLLVRALGHAASHEIGHYLLASPRHTPRGLMRAGLTLADIVEPRRTGYQLDRTQVERLRRGVVELAGEAGDSDGRDGL